ncbi:PTS sugar transporter subunit IIA [Vaginisenegalia massiliensis]|uniref:PTS sugar transporter subunit IIA n=1 Tax=Vaginisenegalia massiliensis TaxID=2058294 RepID=UPI000F53DA64|nr:PTS glucose transporter subunit IIA [Vaginisenegalia massiliensis]
MFNFFKKKEATEIKPSQVTLYAVADGQIINIEEVNDLVFAQKMMGDGYAIIPDNGSISAPVSGQVTNIFPTKHAVGFKAGELEVLLHMGIDTVSLNGEPFTSLVDEGQTVQADTQVSQVDLDQLAAQEKDSAMIVIFTNGNEVVESMNITASGNVTKGQEIGTIVLK